MNSVKDVLPILSYVINMVEKMLNLLGFYFRDERADIVTDPVAEGWSAE